MTCTTIHGFCLELIRPYPIESKIDPGASILDPNDAERIYADRFNHWLRRTLEISTETKGSNKNQPPELARSLFGAMIAKNREGSLVRSRAKHDFKRISKLSCAHSR